MKPIALMALTLCWATTGFSKDVTGKTYRFTVPDDVTFKSHEKLEFYTFRWGTDKQLVVFMLNVNQTPLPLKAIKPMVELMEITFESTLKQQGQTAEFEKKQTELDLGPFKGTQIEFTIKHAEGKTIRQYTFLLHDGSNVWNGYLTTTSTNDDDIKRAHLILKKTKRIANKTLEAAPDSTPIAEPETAQP